jgi:hypothetical protein
MAGSLESPQLWDGQDGAGVRSPRTSIAAPVQTSGVLAAARAPAR